MNRKLIKFPSLIFTLVLFGGYPAGIPEVSGQAYIIGQQTFCIDPNDPLSQGFIFH